MQLQSAGFIKDGNIVLVAMVTKHTKVHVLDVDLFIETIMAAQPRQIIIAFFFKNQVFLIILFDLFLK